MAQAPGSETIDAELSSPTGLAPTSTAATTILPTTSGMTLTPTSDPAVAAKPPTTTSESSLTPVQLVALGPNVWWIADHGAPDEVVEADPVTGEVSRRIWTERPNTDPASGATLACRQVDGSVQPVVLSWSFSGPMRETYNERIELNGEVISQRSIDVDGTSLPSEVNEVCGQQRFPRVLVTPLQLSALLSEAGFTDIAGDHAIDPVLEALATWDGTKYWPLNLFQGDFRPQARPETELLECRMGGLEISVELPTDARSRLVELAGC